MFFKKNIPVIEIKILNFLIRYLKNANGSKFNLAFHGSKFNFERKKYEPEVIT